MLSLLLLSLVLSVAASDTVCLTRFGPAYGHGSELPTRTTTVTITHKHRPTKSQAVWKRATPLAEVDSCPQWTTVTASSVSTVYTGAWNATKTILPSAGHFARRELNVGFRHHAGQSLEHMMPNAYLVECFVMRTVTSLSPSRAGASDKASTMGVSTAPTSKSICSPNVITKTSVTTQDIRCAPTNLVSTIEPGRAIGLTELWNPALVKLDTASSCCQLCMQLEGCSSVQAAVAAQNCWLMFGESKCGLAQIVHQNPDPKAKVGDVVVQQGCGTIEYTSAP